MSSPKSPVFAPPWLRCTVCLLLVLPFPVASGFIIWTQLWWGTTMLPVAAYVSLSSLNCLVSGRPSRSVFSFAADVARGQISARHDNRKREEVLGSNK
jgi:hypothetical protein